MHDPSTIVAERFARIITEMADQGLGRPDGFSSGDRTIYYLVATRCEMDMGGFHSVFDQLLTEKEVVYLVDCLNRLHATLLADAFSRAHETLRNVGFFDDNGSTVSDFDLPDGTGILDAIESKITSGDPLWLLDDALAVLP